MKKQRGSRPDERPKILHCVSAYPDPVAPETQASAFLLALTADRLDHTVFSFKRATGLGGLAVVPFDDAAGDGHRALVYGAPPRGLRLMRTMEMLADWIIADAGRRDLVPEVVHAHKLTMDGLVGRKVAQHFGVPLVITLQANTDARIIRARRDLKRTYSNLFQEAAVILPFSPIARETVETLLAPRTGRTQILPCPTPADEILPPLPRPDGTAPKILTAFNLYQYANKNVEGLISAVARAAREIPDIHLDIIGGGDAAALLSISRMVESIAPGRVTLLGARDAKTMQAAMRAATVFAMPSKAESFGMVYSEALLAGTPCLHSRGRAIDGLLTDGEMTLGVSPGNVAEIADALVRFCREERDFKDRIARAQTEGRLDFLRRDHIAGTYCETIESVLLRSGTA